MLDSATARTEPEPGIEWTSSSARGSAFTGTTRRVGSERLVETEPPLLVDEGRGPFASRAPRPIRSPSRPTRPSSSTGSSPRRSTAANGSGPVTFPSGRWVPGDVLPAVPIAGEDLNAYYDRRALRFFRDVDPASGAIVHSGDSVDIATHEQGHAVLDGVRPDLWDAPHFEAAAFHEAFGDLASIFVALAEPPVSAAVVGETSGDPARSNLVSRLAEELGAAVRRRYGDDATVPRALRDAVNTFRYVDPKTLPDTAPAKRALGRAALVLQRPHGGVLGPARRSLSPERLANRAEALSAAAEALAVYTAAATETAPSGADFFGRFARRIVREADAAEDPAAPELAELLFRRRLLSSPQVPRELDPDEDRGVLAPDDGEPIPPALAAAIGARLPPGPRGEIVTTVHAPGRRSSEPARPARPPAARPLPARTRSTGRPTAPRSRSPTPSPSRFPRPGSCAHRACTRPLRATPTTRGPSSASWPRRRAIADEVEAGAPTHRASCAKANRTPW